MVKDVVKNEENVDLLKLKGLYTPSILKKALSMYSQGYGWKQIAVELEIANEDAQILQANAPTNEQELNRLLASLLQDYLAGLNVMAQVLNDANWVKKHPSDAIHLSSHLVAMQRAFVRPNGM